MNFTAKIQCAYFLIGQTSRSNMAFVAIEGEEERPKSSENFRLAPFIGRDIIIFLVEVN